MTRHVWLGGVPESLLGNTHSFLCCLHRNWLTNPGLSKSIFFFSQATAVYSDTGQVSDLPNIPLS